MQKEINVNNFIKDHYLSQIFLDSTLAIEQLKLYFSALSNKKKHKDHTLKKI